MKKRTSALFLLALCYACAQSAVAAREFHVATYGDDSARGTKSAPLRTIQRAAELAQPGDVVTVHEGTYRERVNPPRGGISPSKRIVYRAAPGEWVEIRGSERIQGWERVQDGVWKVTLPNSFFGAFNPYTNLIRGDWFEPRGREHHTGAVYLNGHWLTEAAKLEEVLSPGGSPPAWLTGGGDQYLLNVAWLQPRRTGSQRKAAADFSDQQGVQKAPASEGGECIGWIENGDWVRYEGVDFGQRTEQLEIRAASATEGGRIEIRLDSPTGELLGSCAVPNTGGWQSWSSFNARLKPVSGSKTICLVFKPRRQRPVEDAAEKWAKMQLWYAKADDAHTTIWAQFRGADPNEQEVEINVRQTVFYPDRPGRNYITVRGFHLSHAATPWAPPTAEQIGLIGTHWSKGWIIEHNEVSYSVCSGIALGKHGDQWDNTSANTAEGYVKTIERGLQNGWNRDTIGHHLVRNNTISHCEQAGIVGSLGAAFSRVEGNRIHNIHMRRLFTGAEMAGIKFHAAIDTVIERNHIYETCLGLWLDWMAQGTRVSRNLFHHNDRDLFVEVNHGPFLVDNNVFASGASLLDVSEGGAYVHNLFGGTLVSSPEPNRETPYHPAHTTTLAGLTTTKGGDCRFYNNIFVGRGQANAAAYGLSMYDKREYPLYTAGNVFYNGARPYALEAIRVIIREDPGLEVDFDGQLPRLQFETPSCLLQADTRIESTASLGKAKVAGLPYEKPDGSALKINRDFFGKRRDSTPTPGPFEHPGDGWMPLNWKR